MKLEKKEQILNAIKTKGVLGQGITATDYGSKATDDILVDLIPPDILKDSLYDLCQKINIVKGSGVKLPRFNTSTIDDDGTYGLQAFWVKEAETIDLSKFALDQKSIKLNKLALIIPVTDEIMEDAEQFVGIIGNVIGKEIRKKLDKAIIYGNGSTGLAMHGVVGTGDEDTVYVTAGSDQSASAGKMIGACKNVQNSIFVLSQDVYAALVLESADAIGGYDPYSNTLYGRPIYVLPGVNDTCMVLCDFSQYVVIQKEIRRQVAESIEFNSDQNFIKVVLRTNGGPISSSTTTDQSGEEIGSFVALSTMEDEEASSEQWEESTSSSSSSSSEDYSNSSESSSSTQSSESSSSSIDSSSSSSESTASSESSSSSE